MFKFVLEHTLAGVQFSISVDRTKSQNISESYLFRFTYQDAPDNGSRRLRGMSMSSSSGRPQTISNVRHVLEKIINRLIDYDILMPDLPGQ